mmetsp:Transcript_3064/g.416  ORF Transcript_3064/g.416 Transcript_3064/m.416 type:complete len:101 (+) Transcript_3064:278-580(+)
MALDINLNEDMETTIISSSGMALTSIELAPINLKRFLLNQCFGSPSQIIKAVSDNYHSILFREVYTVVGHSDLLGNPIGLLNQIIEGFQELYAASKSGFT